MSTQPFDYAAIVADLEAKKNAIEATIASLRSAMGLGALGQAGELASIPGAAPSMSLHNGEIPNGAFLGKSIPEAAKLYLEILKKKQTSREIADALLKGGMESTSKNFYGIVHAVLDRARKSPNSALVKLGTHWGLAGWYPKGIISNATTPPSKKGKKRVRKVANDTDAVSNISAPVKGKANERAIEFLRSGKKAEYGLTDIGEHLGIGLQVARLILGKLVKAGKVEKTAHDTYRLPQPKLVAASI
jgi:hypothetical protein